MDEFAKRSPEELAPYFEAANERMGLDLGPRLIEKDFWVCWVLRRLFSLPSIAPHLTFKGGTSLSKCYGLIRRFSEDIDITIDRQRLGFSGDRDPENKSREKREKLLKELRQASQEYVAGELFNNLVEDFQAQLGSNHLWQLTLDKNDPDQQSLLFLYPTTNATKGDPYFIKAVKIEFGSRGETWPSESGRVVSYTAEALPDEFKLSNFEVTVLSAERTFWEKATILHALFHLPAEKALPSRHSRHYYDIHCLVQSNRVNSLLESQDLLKQVAEHKKKFFRSGGAQYDLAKKGSLKLTPPDHLLTPLKADYQAMESMIFGKAPSWDEILHSISQFERQFN